MYKQTQKLDIIQEVLHTLNAKFQNTKIGTTIYINTMLCFSTMYICSSSGGAQEGTFFTNHLQSTDAADFHCSGRN